MILLCWLRAIKQVYLKGFYQMSRRVHSRHDNRTTTLLHAQMPDKRGVTRQLRLTPSLAACLLVHFLAF